MLLLRVWGSRICCRGRRGIDLLRGRVMGAGLGVFDVGFFEGGLKWMVLCFGSHFILEGV